MTTPHPAAATATLRLPTLAWATPSAAAPVVLRGPAAVVDFLRHVPRPFAWLRAHGWEPRP